MGGNAPTAFAASTCTVTENAVAGVVVDTASKLATSGRKTNILTPCTVHPLSICLRPITVPPEVRPSALGRPAIIGSLHLSSSAEPTLQLSENIASCAGCENGRA